MPFTSSKSNSRTLRHVPSYSIFYPGKMSWNSFFVQGISLSPVKSRDYFVLAYSKNHSLEKLRDCFLLQTFNATFLLKQTWVVIYWSPFNTLAERNWRMENTIHTFVLLCLQKVVIGSSKFSWYCGGKNDLHYFDTWCLYKQLEEVAGQ